MLNNSVTLESLLETHELPFVIIDASLKIVAVNKAWESQFNISRTQQRGKPCCHESGNCRHQRLFAGLEPYAGLFPAAPDNAEGELLRVRGYPLLDADGVVYLGESIAVSKLSNKESASSAMVGNSEAFSVLKTKLLQAADTLAPVLLTGETGTGKELAAEFVHKHSKQVDGEFVVVDCTILNESLFESELFGHEKGSFTGAAGIKKGLFELANNGTLFLDEIGELPLSLQPKLLRALESGQFRRVGGTSTLSSKVRVVCATHRNLADMVKQGMFREDLFYRLSVFFIEIPPLRERRQDLPLLIDHLLNRDKQRQDINYVVTQSALIKMLQHNWPGNIRELRNCLQLASSLCMNRQINEQDVNFLQRSERIAPVIHMPQNPTRQAAPQVYSDNPIEQLEMDFLRGLINKYNGSRKLIAAEMNISERTLYRKLNRFNLN
ncbi:MAG: sigma-54 dependent transcriptional regulator [Methylococcales bacterium]